MEDIKVKRAFERLSTAKTEYKLPERSTKGSAGYDFFAPYRVVCKPKEITFVRTGVKAQMLEDEVLLLFSRSSNAIKKGLILPNGVGVIDEDYYNNEGNEGEIGFAFYNITDKDVVIEKGDKIGQGVFISYLKTYEDMSKQLKELEKEYKKRVGGIGSTGN